LPNKYVLATDKRTSNTSKQKDSAIADYVTIWYVDGKASVRMGRYAAATVCSGASRVTWWQDYFIVTGL